MSAYFAFSLPLYANLAEERHEEGDGEVDDKAMIYGNDDKRLA